MTVINTANKQTKDKVFVTAEAITKPGQMIGVNESGLAVAATDVIDLVVMGVNVKEAASGDKISVHGGMWEFTNSSTNPITNAHAGAKAYVEDSSTVGTASKNGLSTGVTAGIIMYVDAGSSKVLVDMDRSTAIVRST